MNPPAVIRVTADHIEHGEQKYASGCPIALAINEQVDVPEGWIVVDMAELLLYDQECRVWRARTPTVAAHFIDLFDHGHDPIEPFEFAVEWIDQDGVGA